MINACPIGIESWRLHPATLVMGVAVFALCAPSLVPARAQCETAKLLDPAGAADDWFADNAALDGHTLVIGAPARDGWTGAAYVFRYDGTTWIEEACLMPHDLAPGDSFGCSTGVSGDTVVIGAYYDDDNGDASGSGYVFRYDGSQWVEEAKLLPDDGAPDDMFGWSVDIFGGTVVIGAPWDDDYGDRSGSAYVFRFDGSGWNQEAKLLPADGAPVNFFGESAAVWGNTAIIGAAYDDDNGELSGSAYVFHFNGSTWVEQAKLLPSDGDEYDCFGYPVRVHGGVAVIGASWDDVNGEKSGSAYIFRYDGSTWNEEAKLLPSDGAPGDWFGIRADIHDDTAVLGAYFHDDNAGAAYLFRYDGTDWYEHAKLQPTDGPLTAWVGFCTTVDAGRAVVGAHDLVEDCGSAYIFNLDIPGCAADLDRDCDTDLADLGVLLAAWGCTGGGCPGDLNHDGTTNLADLAILLADWGCGA